MARMAGLRRRCELRSEPRPRFANCDLTLSAAAEGQGIALAFGALAEADLAAGYLVRVFGISLPSKVIYSLVVPKTWIVRPKIAAFRRWLLAAAAKSEMPAMVASSPAARALTA